MRTNRTVNFEVPDRELMSPGHLACAGCGATLTMRHALKALGENTILVIPACCWAVIDGPFPYTSVGVSLIHTAFETTAAVASGIRAALEIRGIENVNVVGWAGDGGTFDIGMQALSAAAERNEDIIYVCYDNEAYMNTGIQRSSATPVGAWTTTTPSKDGKSRPKKNLIEIMAAHRIPYAATATVAFLDDFMAKFEKAKSIKGTKVLHIFSPCPPGHRIPENMTVSLSRLAVESGVFPLYEVEDGLKYTINYEPSFEGLEEYFRMQGRFRGMDDERIDFYRKNIQKEWKILKAKAKAEF